MEIALVTGAAAGIGLSIARRLVDRGFRVYGLGGNYSKTPYSHNDFRPVACNLADPGDVHAKVTEILEREGTLFAVVNNAKIYPQNAFAESTMRELEMVTQVNLLCPMVILRTALPWLQKLQGYIVNIVPTSVEMARGGPLGAATGGGLRWMSEALFEELRDYGIKVTNIFPQANRWRPEASPPPQRSNPQSIIDTEAVADAVFAVLDNKRGNYATEIVIRPSRLVEKPIPPLLDVPLGNSPAPGKQGTSAAEALKRTQDRVKEAIERKSEREQRAQEQEVRRQAKRAREIEDEKTDAPAEIEKEAARAQPVQEAGSDDPSEPPANKPTKKKSTRKRARKKVMAEDAAASREPDEPSRDNGIKKANTKGEPSSEKIGLSSGPLPAGDEEDGHGESHPEAGDPPPSDLSSGGVEGASETSSGKPRKKRRNRAR